MKRRERPCDVCGNPTRTRAGKGGDTPRCQPCRIATKTCSIFHRADRKSLTVIQERILFVEQEIGRCERYKSGPHASEYRRALDWADRELSVLRARKALLERLALDTDRISDDPVFIARFLEGVTIAEVTHERPKKPR